MTEKNQKLYYFLIYIVFPEICLSFEKVLDGVQFLSSNCKTWIIKMAELATVGYSEGSDKFVKERPFVFC